VLHATTRAPGVAALSMDREQASDGVAAVGPVSSAATLLWVELWCELPPFVGRQGQFDPGEEGGRAE
jgi:hypothetical protein